MLKQDHFICAELVCMGWRFGQKYGGGNGSHLAGQLVMHALANRTRAGWGSWLQVLQRVPLFMAEKELPPLAYPGVWDAGFVKLLHVVEGIYDGSMPDLAKGGLYWGELGHIENPWFQEKIVNEHEVHPRVCDMNALSFWK